MAKKKTKATKRAAQGMPRMRAEMSSILRMQQELEILVNTERHRKPFYEKRRLNPLQKQRLWASAPDLYFACGKALTYLTVMDPKAELIKHLREVMKQAYTK